VTAQGQRQRKVFQTFAYNVFVRSILVHSAH